MESDLAHEGAQAVLAGFEQFQQRFLEITRRARGRFERREWLAAQQDAIERLELYKAVIDRVTPQVRRLLGEAALDTAVWAEMKAIYSVRIQGREDLELAETFFNSVTRRIFSTVGVDSKIEFVAPDFQFPADRPESPFYQVYTQTQPPTVDSTCNLARRILSDYAFDTPYEDLERDAGHIAQAIIDHLRLTWGSSEHDRIEILSPVFYRSNGAYLIGRVCRFPPKSTFYASFDMLEPGELPRTQLLALRSSFIPIIICLQNPPPGVRVDAVLLDEDAASIVFSYTRSYFHVEVTQPSQLVRFLKTILPLKRVAELYISIGYNKHGKTELYRDLIRHLGKSTDRFEIARGERGMVMVVFTLPSYDLVFKVIRDRVEPPKTTSRQEVMARYDLVFKHDRAGRLVDAQEFEHLSFERERFSPALLDELLEQAPHMVTVTASQVAIKHLYIERRMTPLNLYVKEAPEEQARQAALDYGQAIKDLAATNIFPGDVLLKNFGVTRHGRVVFYDYDELCLVTDCQFRRMPQPATLDDEFSAEPFFYVGPADIFPEEFRTFLGLQGPLRQAFIAAHEDLFGVEFWRGIQARHRQGEVIEVLPYPESKRLCTGAIK